MALNLPCWIFGVIAFLKSGALHDSGHLDGVEFFAGSKVYTSHMQEILEYLPYEIHDDPVNNDFVSLHGFLTAFKYVLNTEPVVPGRSLNHWAPPCGSWVFLNRCTSGRSAENPLGNMSRKYVRLNNMLVSRMILLILVGIVIGVHFLLEQPLTTLMHRPLLLPNNAPNVLNITMCVCLCVIASLIHTKRYEYIDLRQLHHRFRDMLKVLYFYVGEIHTWMGMFGAASPKPTRIWGTVRWLPELRRKLFRFKSFKNQDVVKHYVDRKGKKRVVGGPG